MDIAGRHDTLQHEAVPVTGRMRFIRKLLLVFAFYEQAALRVRNALCHSAFFLLLPAGQLLLGGIVFWLLWGYWMIVDCGLKQELLTVNALSASDYCIIPVQSHFLASEGIPDVLDMVRSVQKHFNPDLKIAGILLTMYQSRPQLCKSVQQSVREVYGDDLHVFDRPIEYTIRIAECPMAGMSILDYEPGNPAAESYRNLASEVLRLG